MIYRYRCNRRRPGTGKDAAGTSRHCGGRRSLRKLIDFYTRRPKCPRCDADTLTLDKYRMTKETGKGAPVCYCDGLPFPHRNGSMWCWDYNGEYTDDDLRSGPPGVR